MTIPRGHLLSVSLLGLLFMIAGVLHFAATPAYVRIVPTWLPNATLLVYLSGIAEILGGMGVLYPPTRRVAAWGLVLLLVCVFPANLAMVTDHARFASVPLWAAWARLPLQMPLIWWAWLYTRR